MTDQRAKSNQAYLLRCWQERPASESQPAVWRFSLQPAMSRDPPQGLASLEALGAFLRAKLVVSSAEGVSADTGSYRSCIVRCWKEEGADSDQPTQWRFMLQDELDTQRQQAFGSFEQLVAFLRIELLG
jgi:hypothetical protein